MSTVPLVPQNSSPGAQCHLNSVTSLTPRADAPAPSSGLLEHFCMPHAQRPQLRAVLLISASAKPSTWPSTQDSLNTVILAQDPLFLSLVLSFLGSSSCNKKAVILGCVI